LTAFGLEAAARRANREAALGHFATRMDFFGDRKFTPAICPTGKSFNSRRMLLIDSAAIMKKRLTAQNSPELRA
jgi:hypothetical protein